jgi:hypothetical protein
VFSSLSIYDFFSPLATNMLWHWALVGMVASIVALNYFALRGLSHRLLQKKPIFSYVLVEFLCFVVEVICNLTHASDVYLKGVQAVQFHEMMFWPTLAVLCSMPVFGVVLAWIDVDLMAEKGGIPSHPVNAQPKPGNVSLPNRAASAPPNPSAHYPANTAPSQQGQQAGKQGNKGTVALNQFFQARGAAGANTVAGMQQSPVQTQAAGGMQQPPVQMQTAGS